MHFFLRETIEIELKVWDNGSSCEREKKERIWKVYSKLVSYFTGRLCKGLEQLQGKMVISRETFYWGPLLNTHVYWAIEREAGGM